MKIIFLDIDGVLNYQSFLKKSLAGDKSTSKLDYDKKYFAPECIERLNKICKTTGAKVVISSSWRIGRTTNYLTDLFKSVGFTGEIIDKTIRLNYQNHLDTVPRGCEIQHWIRTNKGILGKNYLSWCSGSNYVIIDDEGDMLYWQRKHFFQTDGTGLGLTENISYRIINFLKP